MKFRTVVLLVFLIAIIKSSNAQKSNLWLTYNQSTFIYSPGLEFNYLFQKYFGLQLGISTYFNQYDPNKVANISDTYPFNFYNANFGYCANILNKKNQIIGLSLGIKMYYGAEYKPLYYYNSGDYYIYYDASEYMADFGADFGIFYAYHKFSCIIKYNTARNQFRIGLGINFKSRKTD